MTSSTGRIDRSGGPIRTCRSGRSGRTAAVAGAAFVLALALALGATARPFGGAGGAGGSGGTGRMLERLDLSDETRAGVEAVLTRSQEKARPLRDSLAQEREALHALLGASPVDADEALAQVERVGAARTTLEKHRVATSIQMQALMSDDERSAWNDARDARHGRRQRMFERFRGGRMGQEGGFGEEALLGLQTAPLP